MKTNLDMLQFLILDTDNKVFSQEEYEMFLELHGFTPSDEYSPSGLGRLYLVKADLLDAIVENPDKYYSYRKGDISKTFDKKELINNADKIRRRFNKFRS